jgi:hypothetical protein
MTARKQPGYQPEGPELVSYLQKRFISLWRRLSEESDEDERDFFLEEYLRDLEERAYLETTIANQYRGQYLAELLQNVVDAMQRHAELLPLPLPPSEPEEEPAPVTYRCLIRLTDRALYVANDGLPFRAEDVRSITAMGKSTKGAGRYIGYKGLGFRAVLAISDTPEIYSGPYRFRFSRGETLALLKEKSDGVEIGDLPTLSVPFHADPEKLEPVEQEVLEGIFTQGYVTVIRLPLKAGLHQDVKTNCEEFVTGQTLLFLPYITSLLLQVPGAPVREVRRTSRMIPPVTREEKKASLELLTLAGASPKPEIWLLTRPVEPATIPAGLTESLNDRTWAGVQNAGMALAFPAAEVKKGGLYFKRRRDPLTFFTFFPTGEASGAGIAVHADFYLSASRKEIDQSLLYNRWLVKEVVEFLCNAAIPTLQEHFPDEALLVDLLLDVAYHNGPFGHSFRQWLDERLAASPFVPAGAGRYYRPREMVWTPLTGAGVVLFRRVFPEPPDGYHYPVIQLEETYIEEEEGFEYRRVRRFLRDIGMRPVSPEELPELLPQAFQNLEDGVVSVSDICATLALWLEQLAKNTLTPEERQRSLLNIARQLAVLPVGNGWEKPGAELYDWPATEEGFRKLRARQEFFGPVKVISEKCYSPENREFEAQIREWHKRLGVKSLDPEPELPAWDNPEPDLY